MSFAVMMLRRTDPNRRRPFKTPLVNLIAPISIAGCIYLFFSLDDRSKLLFVIWAAIGLLVYFVYSRSRSHVGRGSVEVHEPEIADIDPPVPGTAN